MYEKHWGLKEKPFQNTPDPRFVYLSQQHLDAAALMIYVIKENLGAGMLTGEYGSGKTVISRLLFEILPRSIFDFAIVIQPQLTPLEMLTEICNQFDIKSSSLLSKNDCLEALNEHFFVNLRHGKQTIIIIDEAQSIVDPLTFEEIRFLLNFQLNDRFLTTLLLFGQTALLEKIRSLPPLNQRITLRYNLTALGQEDTNKYISYRLQVAGTQNRIFSAEARQIIWEHSGGIPRVINTIADWCLLLGYSRLKSIIDEQLALKAVNDLGYILPEE
jgi:general secretion pathway protein A